MKSCLQIMLVAVVSVVVGCGAEQHEQGEPDVEAMAEHSKPKAESVNLALIAPYYALHLELWNASSADRICQMSYTFTAWDGSSVSGTVVAAEMVYAGGQRTDTIYVPLDHTARITAACWHEGYPEVDVRATNSLTTLPMRDGMTCQAIYDESSEPTMAIPCWKT